jgi:plasmid stabilization system protein ParE
MMLPVYHHQRVIRALEEGYAWWSKHRSPEQAIRWLNGFAAAIDAIAVNPRQHAKAAESHLFPYEVRELNFGLGPKPSHRALFVIRPEMVYVIAIRHLAQQPVSPDDLD